MGAGIAQQAAASGYQVRVLDVDDAAWKRGLGIITKGLGRMLAKEKITQADSDATLSRLSYSTDASSLADVDYVIEAVFEDYDVKKDLFARLELECRPEVVFATNTSSISITEIAAASRRPDRVVGMHFFNPVPVMKLVEIIPALQTDPAAVELATAVTEEPGQGPRGLQRHARFPGQPHLDTDDDRRRPRVRIGCGKRGGHRHGHEARGQHAHGPVGADGLHRRRYRLSHRQRALRVH